MYHKTIEANIITIICAYIMTVRCVSELTH